MTDTLVIFASGATIGRGRVVRTTRDTAGGLLVVADTTPFHPVDHSWPDQPGDTGWCGEDVVINTGSAAQVPHRRWARR